MVNADALYANVRETFPSPPPFPALPPNDTDVNVASKHFKQ